MHHSGPRKRYTEPRRQRQVTITAIGHEHETDEKF